MCVCVWDSGSAARDERGVKSLLGKIRLISTWLCSTLVQLLLWDTLGIDGKLIQSGDEAHCFVSWPLWLVASNIASHLNGAIDKIITIILNIYSEVRR